MNGTSIALCLGGTTVAIAACVAAFSASRSAFAAPSPTASVVASASGSAGVSDALPRPTMSTYAWPTQTSDPPKDEEWTKAIALETVTVGDGSWKGTRCAPRVVREWVELACTPPDSRLFAVAWNVAGADKDTKAWFKMLGELGPPPDRFEASMKRIEFAVAATVVFPVRRGSAFVVDVDQGGVDENYDGGVFVFTQAGISVDVSWASGEAAPSILVL